MIDGIGTISCIDDMIRALDIVNRAINLDVDELEYILRAKIASRVSGARDGNVLRTVGEQLWHLQRSL